MNSSCGAIVSMDSCQSGPVLRLNRLHQTLLIAMRSQFCDLMKVQTVSVSGCSTLAGPNQLVIVPKHASCAAAGANIS
jgi:hypothetical protein